MLKVKKIGMNGLELTADETIFMQNIKGGQIYRIGDTKENLLTFELIDAAYTENAVPKGKYQYYYFDQYQNKKLIDSNNLDTVIHGKGTKTQKSFFKPKNDVFQTTYPKKIVYKNGSVFKSLKGIINAVGSAEKSVSDNYINYLDRHYPEWHRLDEYTDKSDKVVKIALTHSKVGYIQFKDANKIKPTRIDVYQHNVLDYQVLLNRRNNATMIKQTKDDLIVVKYLDIDFKNYLTVEKSSHGEVLGFDVDIFNEHTHFSKLFELLNYMNKPNHLGINYSFKSILVTNANYAKNTLTLKLPKDTMSDISQVTLRKQELSFCKNNEDNTMTIKFPEKLDLPNGFTAFRVMYRGIPFRLVRSKTTEIPNGYFDVISVDKYNKVYFNVNKNGTFGALMHEINKDSEYQIVTHNDFEISSYTFKNDTLILIFKSFPKKDCTFYTIQNGHKHVLNHMMLTQHMHQLSGFEDMALPIYVEYQVKQRKIVRKLSTTQILDSKFNDAKVDIKVTAAKKSVNLTINASKSFKADTFLLDIRHRGNKESLIVAPKIDSELDDNQLVFKFNLSDFPLPATLALDDYDNSIYDVSIIFGDEFGNSMSSPKRLKWNSNIKAEIRGQFTPEFDYLLAPYGTSNKELLSFRTYFIPKDALDFYENQKKQNSPERNKRPVIVVVEAPNKAQDNGLHMFKYLIDNHHDEFDTYYVLTAESPDIVNLEGYEENVIAYKSQKHFEIMNDVDLILHTNSSFYAYPLNTNYWIKKRNKAHKIFLQHGIIGVRDLARLYGAQTHFTNKFIVSSEREKKIVVNKMGYAASNVMMTGLARFDALLKDASAEKTRGLRKKILIMPSWRKFQDQLLDEKFLQTDFYKGWQSFINNPYLAEKAKQDDLEISFYLHHNFQKYAHLFKSDFVQIIEESDTTIQKLLLENGLLITDFSSVALDFALQERKVFYYQVDNAISDEIDELADFFPGKIYMSEDKIIEDVVSAVDNPTLSKDEQKKLDNLYLQRDTEARYRTYLVVLKLLRERKNSRGIRRVLRAIKRRVRRLLKAIF